MLIKYIKSVLWRVAKRQSYIEDARCLKVNSNSTHGKIVTGTDCENVKHKIIYAELLETWKSVVTKTNHIE